MKNLIDSTRFAQITDSLKEWILIDLPVVIGLIIALLVLLKISKFAIKRLTDTLINHAKKKDIEDVQESEKRINTLMGIVWGVTRIFLSATVVMVILQKIGINIAPILASAGIIGLAVGFGAQELVKDIISGFFILLENQIRTGDVAIINGTSGLVETIQLRTITLRDFSGIVHIIQNGKIDTLSNRTKEWSACIFDIGVAYKESVSQVMEIMKQTADDIQADPEFKSLILEPIEMLGLDQFGDSALVIKARMKTKPSKQWTVKREFNRRLKIAFDKENIEIPFPHTTVYWGDKIAPLNLNIQQSAKANILN